MSITDMLRQYHKKNAEEILGLIDRIKSGKKLVWEYPQSMTPKK